MLQQIRRSLYIMYGRISEYNLNSRRIIEDGLHRTRTGRARIYPKHNIPTWVLTMYSWWRTHIYLYILYAYTRIVTTVDEDLLLILITARCAVYVLYISYAFLPRRARPTHSTVGLRLQIVYLSFLRPFRIWRIQIPLLARTLSGVRRLLQQ